MTTPPQTGGQNTTPRCIAGFLRFANRFLRNEETIGCFYALQTGFLLSEQGKRVILVNFAFRTLT
jgi:hypothetical protein